MNRRQVKKEILTLLEEAHLEEILLKLPCYPEHLLLNPLFIALCNPLEIVKWHAVCCFGQLVPAVAERELESARIIMRRFLWSLNDESGGIGWGAPESLAEIMCYSAKLRKEFLHMLISYMREDGEEAFQDGNYIELPMLQRGLLWGIARMCICHPEEMKEQHIDADVEAYLDSPDNYVSGLAIWCLGLLGTPISKERVTKYLNSDLQLKLFVEMKLQSVKVSQLSKILLAQTDY